jgi:hypothetical protein
MTNRDVVLKLIGKIKPAGEANEDEKRLANLEELMSLVEGLLFDIDEVAEFAKRQEYSLKLAGDKALGFQRRMLELFYPTTQPK